MTSEFTGLPNFSAQEQLVLMSVIDASMQICSADAFISWTTGPLQRIFPHKIMFAAIGELEEHSFHIKKFINHNFPSGFVEASRLPNGTLAMPPLLKKWWSDGKPILFHPDLQKMTGKSFWGSLLKKYDLQNKAAHGIRSLENRSVSYFTFHQIPEKLTARHAYLLEMLVPHMYVAFMRFAEDLPGPSIVHRFDFHAISPREAEILKWIQLGKTNWEIGEIMQLSEKTIKTYIERILKKLGVANRTHAVTKALSLKIIVP